jgi:formate hydrogenlyase subunit 6/NADH:ubiquinone oxidoreductase subunit I
MKNFLNNLIRKHNLDKGNIHNDSSKCLYCGKCQSCRAKAIKVDRKEKTWILDNEKCVRCGHCVFVCPVKSLSFVK